MSDDIPAAWLPVLRSRGLDSYRKLGGRAGISHEAARRVVRGWNSSRRSIDAVADAIGLSPERVHELRGEAGPDRSGEWVPPEASSLLTHEEREAVSRLIVLLAQGREDVTGNAPSMTTSGSRPRREPEPPRATSGTGTPAAGEGEGTPGSPGLSSRPRRGHRRSQTERSEKR